MVPKNTVKRVAKSLELGKGVQIKISKANVRKHTGQRIFTSLLPVLRTVAPTVGKTLGLSALAGLASEGASQLVKKITGGQALGAMHRTKVFQVPNKDLFRLAVMSDLLNKGQIRDLAKAHQNGSDMLFRLTQKQVGNGIGSIIANIGIPMILDAIRGKGVGRGGPRIGKGGPRIGPPPFIGNWSIGIGKKKKDQRARSTTRKKQSFQGNTISGRHIVAQRAQRPVFKKTVPMSNFDLLEWCKYLKIPIKNVFADFSRGLDLVDHNALVLEMQCLGVHEATIRWISSFLTDRIQRVKIEGVYSDSTTPRGGIPQGTKLAPLLFAILVNRLCQDWPERTKYVDDTSVFEIVPRCSPSYLPLIANGINKYATQRNMRLNEKKCKEITFITFLKYQPSPVPHMFLNGAAIGRVSSFKLLGVTLSNDLSWNDHCDEMFKKACKRLYALRSLKAAGLNQKDLVLVYCSLVRSVFEYASPVWAALPIYLQDMLEAVQKKALYIIFGKMEYKEAMETAGLQSLCARRNDACVKFIAKARISSPLNRIIPSPILSKQTYDLRNSRPRPLLGRTNRFNDFITLKLQHII